MRAVFAALPEGCDGGAAVRHRRDLSTQLKLMFMDTPASLRGAGGQIPGRDGHRGTIALTYGRCPRRAAGRRRACGVLEYQGRKAAECRRLRPVFFGPTAVIAL